MFALTVAIMQRDDGQDGVENGSRASSMRLDRCLDNFAPWARLIIITGPYYMIGAFFYSVFETKPCESTIMLNDPGYDPRTCREAWSFIDGLYFTTVSMATVGYGDLVARTALTRAFTAIWIIVGVSFVFYEIVRVFQGAIKALTTYTHVCVNWVLNVSPGEGAAGSGDQSPALGLAGAQVPLGPQAPVSFFYYYFRGIWVALLWFLAFQVGVAAIIAYADPQMNPGDIGWYLFITASTVGYGDVNVRSQTGRLLAVGHVLLSVIWLAAILGHLSGMSSARARQLTHGAMLRRRLDAELISKMDKDGNGVDAIEFLVETLVHLGCDIGGERLHWRHVHPILMQFRAFDVDHDGRLTHKDLAKLVQLQAAMVGDPDASDALARAAAGCDDMLEGATSSSDAQARSRWLLGGARLRATQAMGAVSALDAHIQSLAANALKAKRWDDGTTYAGAWKNGRPCGHGKTRWPDGSAYEGMHQDGVPHGKGTMSYADGTRWEGPWFEGQRHGFGVRTSADGKREEGEWFGGQRARWAQPAAAAASAEELEKRKQRRTQSLAHMAVQPSRFSSSSSTRVVPITEAEQAPDVETPT